MWPGCKRKLSRNESLPISAEKGLIVSNAVLIDLVETWPLYATWQSDPIQPAVGA
jgi:hypothetical protein